MLVKCPSCNTEYDCEPGKFKCACGVKFMLKPDGVVFVVSDAHVNDRDTMSFPGRMNSGEENSDMKIPMPGLRERKTPGRFHVGEMILGRYMVLSELGQGCMGVGCKCFDETAGIVVALNSLPPDLLQNTQKMEAVKATSRLVCNLRHPNIACCNALETDHATGRCYLISEYVEGEDLRHWTHRMRREGHLTQETALPVIRQIADALDYAHGEKIVHCDIRPDSIMIDRAGHVKVLNFGIDAQIRAGMTGANTADPWSAGTAPYMAPEQWNGVPPGPASDQYALAVMTYEMLAGHLPFDGADEATLRDAVLTRDPAPIASLPNRAQTAVAQALSKDPANRFRTCSDFIDALEGKAGRSRQEKGASVPAAEGPRSTDRRDTSEQPHREPPGQEIPRRNRKRGRKAAGILFALVMVAAVVFLAFYRRNDIPGLSDFIRSLGVEQIVGPSASVQISDERKTIPLSDEVSLELVKVEAGTFEMSAKDGENTPDEVPHRATLTQDFYIGQTEVTQAQWTAVMGNNPSEFKGDDLPVDTVSWNDVMEFCEKLNSTGKAPAGWKFSLPTETQWEYAARGGNKSKGYKYSGSDDIDEVAWYWRNSGDTRQIDSTWSVNILKSIHCKSHPVGQKKANELGLYDMSGNVYEWCLDDGNDDSSRQRAEFSRNNDSNGSVRVRRGGGWGNGAEYCRSAVRLCIDGPDLRLGDLGFRVALVPAAGYGSASEAKLEDTTQQKPPEQTAAQSGGTSQQQTPLPLGDRTTFFLPGNVKMELVKVAAGTFEISKKDGEFIVGGFKLPRQVTFTRDFYLGQTEVTQAQWMAVMGNNPSEFKGDDLPVVTISWNDAMSFCENLNKTGTAPAGWKFTLPTEMQWEYAACGGNKSKGYKFSGSDSINEVAWYMYNSSGKIQPVGRKKANELGLYDMSGNVNEWCLDDWQEKRDDIKPEFTRDNDQGGRRAIHGGCWNYNANDSRLRRWGDNVSFDYLPNNLGFRVVLVPATGYGAASEAKPENAVRQQPSGDKTIPLSNGAKLELMKVEAGTFTMSANDGENDNDEVSHQATLTKDFYIGQTEVTQAQWKAVMGSGSNPSNFKGDDLPVEQVSWNDAMEFCEKLNTTGKAPGGWKFTLPTETQWEFAARGGNKSKGFKSSGSNNADEVAWYYENSGDNRLSDSSWDYNKLDSNHCKTHPVGQKKANELGLYDMSGNVLEWCLDDWQAKSDKLTAEFTRGNDRVGSRRAFRGGGWFSLARYCRSADRSFKDPGYRFNDLGFRVALVPVEYQPDINF